MKTGKWLYRLGVVLGCLAGGWGHADVIISRIHTWDLGEHGWTAEYGDIITSRETTGGNPDGWLKLTFPVTTLPETGEIGWYDIVHVSPDNLLATYRTGVRFDFWAQDQLPQDLQLQFHSTSGNVWGYNITDRVRQTGTWTPIGVPLTYSDAWGGLPGYDDTLDQFVSDLASMDWIGVYIWREEASQEVYGLDNFHFMVPEPGEMVMLALALLTAGLAVHRRDSVAGPRPCNT